MQYNPVVAAVSAVFSLYRWILIIRVLSSWLPADMLRHPVVRFIHDVTEPVLAPIRRLLPSMGAMDFSPLLAFFLLQVVQGIVVSILVSALG